MIEVLTTDLHARLTKLTINDQEIITPNLVPVVDPKDNIISPNEMKEKFDFRFIITSSYLFLKRYGMPSNRDNIHNILNYNDIIMMDSGAYQILNYGDADIDYNESLNIQSNLKTDIGVILDVPTPPSDDFDVAKTKVDMTIERIELSLPHIKKHPETIWTLPIQGGKNYSLIKYYISAVKDRGYLPYFKFYALGSVVPIMANYDYSTLFRMIYTARKNLPYNTALHIFGAGHPMIFPFIVALGADTFDSAAYVLFAKDDRYMTPYGTVNLRDMDEFPCTCEVCSRWSPKELLQADKKERVYNLALHNLYSSVAELKTVRQAIRDERLWDLLEQRSLAHPALYGAFHELRNILKKGYFEEFTPNTKSGGIKIYTSDSFYRPELTKSRKRILSTFRPNSTKLLIIPLRGNRSPIEIIMYNRRLKDVINNTTCERDIALFLPFIGLIPVELLETFPFSQFVFSNVITKDLIELSAEKATEFILKMNYKEVEIDYSFITIEEEYKEDIKIIHYYLSKLAKYCLNK